MANDVYYGADAECRIGIRADKDTAPTAWFNVEFNRVTISPQTDKPRRPRLGAARQNSRDPLRPREGLQRFSMDVTIDADTLMLPRWLRLALGAPTTSGPDTGLYTHVWSSGAKTEIYFDAAFRLGSEKVTWVKACSLGALSTDWSGDQAQDFDIQLTFMALDRSRDADWPSGTVTAVTTPSPILRPSALFDDVAADQLPSGGFTWDRNLQADFYATTGSASKLASYLRPGEAPSHSARATLRGHGSDYEDLADAGDEFSAELRYLGVTTGHEIRFAHPQANMNPIPADIGTGVFERALSWTAHQSDDTPACQVTVINNVAAYA
ncbi:MAG: hypothetical protein KF842_06770 [Caulobacter sp.]|nr:hypothetical protein [Caulobacter sp.]